MMTRMTGFINGRKKHKGNALVMVIITIAFIGMLVAMVVYGAYGNFVMKANDTRGRNNFYTAEGVLDIINAGIQIDVSDAILDAYTYATKLSDLELAGDSRDVVFRQRFVTYMKDKIADPAEAGAWQLSYIKGKLINGKPDDMALPATEGFEGAYVGINPSAVDSPKNKLEIGSGNGFIAIRNLRVVYTDSQGYVSAIETDIRITTPKMKTAGEQRAASVQEYCMIANNSIIVDTDLGGTNNLEIGGNVNAGKVGLKVGNQSKVQFLDAPSDAGVDTFYYLVGKDLSITKSDNSHGISVSDKYTSFWNDIIVDSSKASFNGTMYVADDLDVEGKNSNVTLAGNYFGYGNAVDASTSSSSIIINGANSTINTTGLNEMILAGNTFIGATSYDADKRRYDGADESLRKGTSDTNDEIIDVASYEKDINEKGLIEPDGVDSITDAENNTYYITPQNASDIIMGGSIGAKAEQMLYLIPSECIAYDHRTGTQIVGMGKNPMTKEEFDKLSKTKVKTTDADGHEVETDEYMYDVINLNSLWTKLDSSYTDVFKAVYRRINGTVMVYLYLDFGSNESNAAAFLKAYYEKAPEELESYISPYINKTNSAIGTNLLTRTGEEGDYEKLTVQGNYFYYDADGKLQMIDGNVNTSSAKTSRILDMQDQRSIEYDSRLYTNHPDSTNYEKSVFKNLIYTDRTSIGTGTTRTYTKLWTDDTSLLVDGHYPDSPDYHAVICDGNYTYNGSDSKICVIVATGDIYLNKDFSGTVIAGNNIYIGAGCNKVNRETNLVRQALKNLGDESLSANAGKRLSDYFKEDVSGAGAAGTNTVSEEDREEDENRSIGKYITYENWRKE